tara:strand:+ start:439 stop:597 length:159 start_codon:yes stop_codon:yes gene_type:complete
MIQTISSEYLKFGLQSSLPIALLAKPTNEADRSEKGLANPSLRTSCATIIEA